MGIHYLTVYCHSCGLRFCLGQEYRGITTLLYRYICSEMCVRYLQKNMFVEKSRISVGYIYALLRTTTTMTTMHTISFSLSLSFPLSLVFKFTHGYRTRRFSLIPMVECAELSKILLITNLKILIFNF